MRRSGRRSTCSRRRAQPVARERGLVAARQLRRRCPPTARSATSASAGPATPRPSRRPAPRCSTPRRSGASWLRDLALEQDPSARRAERRAGRGARRRRCGSAAPAGPMPRPSCRGPCTSRTATPSVHRATSATACAAGSTRWSARRGQDGLLGPSAQFGDWLDPDAPPDRPWEAKADSDLLANAFFAHSARLAGDGGAARSGDEASAARLSTRSADRGGGRDLGALGRARASRPRPAARSRSARDRAGRTSAPRVGGGPRDAGPRGRGRVRTGLPGHAARAARAVRRPGYLDEAYLMLLRREPPSWLYQVDQGATTVWERWDAILPDGSIHPGTHEPAARRRRAARTGTCSRSTTTPTAP